MGGPEDFTFITPEEAAAIDSRHTPEQWRKIATSNPACEVCGRAAWKFGDVGMCFTCATGEADASDDYELQG